MQQQLFRCRCGTGLQEPNAEHATHSWQGEVFCSYACKAEAQTVAKCHDLSIHYNPAVVMTTGQRFASDIFVPPPTGDP